MNGAYYIGATGLQAQQRGLDVIANNVANINTPAFKRSEVRFSEMVAEPAVRDEDTPVVTDLPETLTGVQASASPRIFEQGDLRETGKPFDIAVSGDGFLEVLGPGGQVWLWRGGTLRTNEEGFLETETGLLLKANIEIPEDATGLKIARDGKVTATTAGAEEPVELGTIDLVMSRDTAALEAVGNGYYRVADEEDLVTLNPGEDKGGVFVQGSIEQSNVELTTEMVTLLLMQRAYAANAQIVQAGDQLMAIANGLKR